MAEDDNDADTGTEDSPPSGKKKIIMLIVIALVLVVVSIGGTLIALKFMGGDEGSDTDDPAAEEIAEPEKKPAIYYPLKPTIIVNFNARGKQRFLQAEVSLLVRDEDVVAAVEEHSVMLQHTLLMLFSSQDYAQLQTAEGKELLRQQSLAEMQRILEQETGKPGVEQVLFTNLVMQ